MDKLRVLQKLYKEENGSARIFKFVADPPTTTLQRLKVHSLAVKWRCSSRKKLYLLIV